MKIIYVLKTISVYDLKVGCYTELIYLIELHEYQTSRSLFDLPQSSLHFQTKILFFSKTVGLFETKYRVKASGGSERNKLSTGLGHMTKMAATPICSKHL